MTSLADGHYIHETGASLQVLRKMKKARIVIAGGGFAGLYAAKYLDKTLAWRSSVEVTLIARDR